MRKLLPLLIFLLTIALAAMGQPANADADARAVSFRFVPGDDMFYIPWAGNGAELEKLHALLDDYRAEIASGAMPVRVDAYCVSRPTAKENLTTAFIRANRVKSELILRKGLTEDNFITGNYARKYEGLRDVVIVTLRIPAAEPAEKTEPVAELRPEEPTPQPEPVVQPATPAERTDPPAPTEPLAAQPAAPTELLAAQPAAPTKPYCVAVRTNLLYDALLLPTLGIEWRIDADWGIKLDGSLSWWGDEKGKVQKMWLINPEVRRYMLRDRRFYAGISGNYGQCNLYKYALGGILSGDTGYQGDFWSAGLTVGYQLRLSGRFSMDFNVGLGYTRFAYDTFGMIDGVRVSKARNLTKNFWGPTQAGISLMWTIGNNK